MSGAPYILYGGGVTRSMGVQLVLEELGLPYELKPVDIGADEHRRPEFLAVNPAGFIPALVTPAGEVLHETAAIMLWLAESQEAWELVPAPTDPLRGRFLSWLFYFTNDIQPPTKRFFYPHRYATQHEAGAEVKALAYSQVLERWAVLDGYLKANGPLHLGERFSLADMHLAMWAAYGLDSLSELLNRFDAVRACFERAAGRPRSGPLLLEFQRDIRARSKRPWLPD